MMRFQTTSTLFLAGAIGIPAIAVQQDGSLESLEAALKATQQAIEEVMNLQGQIASRNPEALSKLEGVTERPVGSTSETVDHIIVLQQEIDNLRRAEAQQIAGTRPLPQVRTASPAKNGPELSPRAPAIPANSPPEIHGLQRPEQSVAIEGEGYSLDDVRRGKLLVRAGKPSEAIAILQGKTGSHEGSYWLARGLQDTGDMDGALEIYGALAEDESAGEFQQWAQQEKAMIELRRRLKGSTRAEAAPR